VFRIHAGIISLWLTAEPSALEAQQYAIETYAGGAPGLPTGAISIAVDPSGNLYFADGYGFNTNPARSNSVFKIDRGGLITRFAGGGGFPYRIALLRVHLGIDRGPRGQCFRRRWRVRRGRPLFAMYSQVLPGGHRYDDCRWASTRLSDRQ
jgi:hypothetical protein